MIRLPRQTFFLSPSTTQLESSPRSKATQAGAMLRKLLPRTCQRVAHSLLSLFARTTSPQTAQCRIYKAKRWLPPKVRKSRQPRLKIQNKMQALTCRSNQRQSFMVLAEARRWLKNNSWCLTLRTTSQLVAMQTSTKLCAPISKDQNLMNISLGWNLDPSDATTSRSLLTRWW